MYSPENFNYAKQKKHKTAWKNTQKANTKIQHIINYAIPYNLIQFN